MGLWTEDDSLTLNGAENDGKAAVQAFFLSTGYFHNNWVSLAPEYKTQVTVQVSGCYAKRMSQMP